MQRLNLDDFPWFLSPISQVTQFSKWRNIDLKNEAENNNLFPQIIPPP